MGNAARLAPDTAVLHCMGSLADLPVTFVLWAVGSFAVQGVHLVKPARARLQVRIGLDRSDRRLLVVQAHLWLAQLPPGNRKWHRNVILYL